MISRLWSESEASSLGQSAQGALILNVDVRKEASRLTQELFRNDEMMMTMATKEHTPPILFGYAQERKWLTRIQSVSGSVWRRNLIQEKLAAAMMLQWKP